MGGVCKIGTEKDKESWDYINGGGIITAHLHKDQVNVGAHASSKVDGSRTIVHPDGTEEDSFEEASESENHNIIPKDEA